MGKSELLAFLREAELTTVSGRRLRDYCLELVKSGSKLPGDKGDVNRSAVAEAIGLSRQVFYPGRGSQECRDLLGWAVESIGVNRPEGLKESFSAGFDGVATGEVSVLLQRLREADKRISKLAGQVAERGEEIEVLRKENATLRKKLSQAEIVHDARLEGYEIIL